MNCSHCGTPLPDGALFCGECGRRVASVPADGDRSHAGRSHAAQTGSAHETESSRGRDNSGGADARNSDSAPELQGPPRRATATAFGLADALADAVADTGPGGALDQIRGRTTAEAASTDLDHTELGISRPPGASGADAGVDAAGAVAPGRESRDEVVNGPLLCAQCGATMQPDDIFCEECGFVSSAVTAAFTGVIPTLPPPARPLSYVSAPPVAPVPETHVQAEDEPELIVPPAVAVAPVETQGPVLEPEPVFEPEPELDREAERSPKPEREPDPEPAPLPEQAAPVDPVVMPAPPADSRPIPLQPPAGTPVPLPTMPLEVMPSAGIAAPEPSAPPLAFAPPTGRSSIPAPDINNDEDTEITRIVSRRAAAERFVLQFSTGESVSVSGTGLIGRNPRQEPGEFFDHIVRVLDTGRSVSKTHLEFGQEDGAFWVLDRFSGNGTVVRNPESEPVRCEPGKRFRVARGSRVEIGEQFFVVS